MTGFDLETTDGAARTGTLRTAHGDVRTPAFMPVGTAATVKAIDGAMVSRTTIVPSFNSGVNSAPSRGKRVAPNARRETAIRMGAISSFCKQVLGFLLARIWATATVPSTELS